MHSFLVAAFIATIFVASTEATSCNATSHCPASAPCCSEFGFCGTNNFCLGGCNPFASNAVNSCRPDPICTDKTHTFADNSRILSNATFFDGNASAHDWVVDKGNIMNTNSSGGELALLLTQANGGTRISSTRYLHYGTVTAKIKTGRWAGVVTAFITMSDIKDEIDWEFPGAATTEGQTNYFWQGVIPTGKNNGGTSTGLTDTFTNYHSYTIDWQPDALTFSIDGGVVRTVKKSDTVNATTGIAQYPTTPARIQLSLWPAGISSSPPGTVTWAGGMINWDDPDYKSAGHFYALVKEVDVKCANLQTGPNLTSYAYDANATSNSPVVDYTNRSTLLNGAGPVVALGGAHNMIVLVTSLFVLFFHVL